METNSYVCRSYRSKTGTWGLFCPPPILNRLNTAGITFCLRYSLNTPHSNQTPSFFPMEDAVTIFSKFRFRQHFTTPSQENNLDIFLCVWFYHCHCRRNYILHSFFYRFQALKLNLVEYFRFTNCYGKANKKRISWHRETWMDTDCLLVSQ